MLKKILKWTGLILGGLIVVLLLVGTVFYFTGKSRADATYTVDTSHLLNSVSADSATIVRGEHLSHILACRECHGANLAGTVFLDIPPFRATATNLTPGTKGVGDYTVQDLDRSIRHAINPDGKLVFPVMPSAKLFSHLSDEDTEALIAYLQSLDPIDNDLPPTEVKLPGTLLIYGTPGFDVSEFKPDDDQPHAVRPPVGPTAEYGEYLASVSCVACHGDNLEGGIDPEGNPSPSLAAAGTWSRDEFARAMREGVTPSGYELNPRLMPWEMAYYQLDDVEIEALQQHIQSKQ